MEHEVEVEPGITLWVHESGTPTGEPLLLIMGANASGAAWPDQPLSTLAQRHRVIHYDHRDTGRSTWAFDTRPYPITQLASDAVSVLDALGVRRAHVAGLSLGATLVQVLLLDHPERLLTATVWSCAALGAWNGGTGDLPGPDPMLLALWAELATPRDREAEIAWRVEHWRLLRGSGPFDAEEFRRLEERVIAHTGRHDNPAAHARADPSGLDRGAELSGVRTPTLVIDAPEDPVNPRPHAAHLAAAIPAAALVTIPGLGHALGSDVLPALAGEILRHTARHPGPA